MKRIIFSCVALFFLATLPVGAQEATVPAENQPPRPAVMPAQPPMPRMNPTMLMRMRGQLTFQIQQTQRTLGFIDPSDTQLTKMLQDEQSELLNQLKEIDTQLKAQGIPLDGDDPTGTAAPIETALPKVPRSEDPTMQPGGVPRTPQQPVDPNLLIQRQGLPPQVPLPGTFTPGATTGLRSPGMDANLPPGFSPETFDPPGAMTPQVQPPQTVTPPAGFDQDQAWAESPWVPQPSRELTELKQTVDQLRTDLAEMKESIKALETQLRLLNRLLTQQPATIPTPVE